MDNYYDYEVEASYMPSEEDIQDWQNLQEDLCISCGEEIEGTNHDGQCEDCWLADEMIDKGIRFGGNE